MKYGKFCHNLNIIKLENSKGEIYDKVALRSNNMKKNMNYHELFNLFVDCVITREPC